MLEDMGLGWCLKKAQDEQKALLLTLLTLMSG